MTATSHAIIGTLIAAKFGNPYLAIPIAMVSHVAADIFPHWDSGTHEDTKSNKRIFNEAIVDVFAGFTLSYALIYLLFPQTSIVYAFIMIIAAQWLDWAVTPYYFFHWKSQPFKWIYDFSYMTNSKLEKPWGIINQVTLLLFLIILAKIY